MYSFMQRLRSLRHGLWFEVSERIRWSRGAFEETPAGELCNVNCEQAERIAALKSRYQVQFESRLSAATSHNNYEYLDILDRSCGSVGPTHSAVVCDIGCASFWYAATLESFFRPKRLIGVEIEGHRLFRDGRSRIDYATGYLAHLPHAQFIVADYRNFEQPADVITSWFPFLTPAALLAWRLPLTLLGPECLFRQIVQNLGADGLFFMANHGSHEWALAQGWCGAAGLRCVSVDAMIGPFSSHRSAPPVASWWRLA
jgi:SAM-dependent methyltransferase